MDLSELNLEELRMQEEALELVVDREEKGLKRVRERIALLGTLSCLISFFFHTQSCGTWTRTKIRRSRICSPTIRRSRSSGDEPVIRNTIPKNWAFFNQLGAV